MKEYHDKPGYICVECKNTFQCETRPPFVELRLNSKIDGYPLCLGCYTSLVLRYEDDSSNRS